MAIEFYLETANPTLGGPFERGPVKQAAKLVGPVGLSLFADLTQGGGMLGTVNKSNVMIRAYDQPSLVYIRKFATEQNFSKSDTKARISGVSTVVKEGKEQVIPSVTFEFGRIRLSPGDIQVSRNGGFGGFWELYFENVKVKIFPGGNAPAEQFEFDFKTGKPSLT